jgi:hypothetical protein
MNQQIEQLALQAGFNLHNDVIDGHDFKHEIEKLAELIVRECVAICKDIDGEDNIDARSGRQDCAVEIREHFGVEE